MELCPNKSTVKLKNQSETILGWGSFVCTSKDVLSLNILPSFSFCFLFWSNYRITKRCKKKRERNGQGGPVHLHQASHSGSILHNLSTQANQDTDFAAELIHFPWGLDVYVCPCVCVCLVLCIFIMYRFVELPSLSRYRTIQNFPIIRGFPVLASFSHF